jgi:hypothetical protein
MEYAHHGYVSLHAANAGDGASNRGMGNEGLFLEANKPYEGRFYAHADDVTGGTVVVALRNYITGDVLASTTVEVPPYRAGAKNFSRFNFSLTPAAGTLCHGIAPGSDPDVLCGQQCGKATLQTPANPHCMSGPPAGTSMAHDGHICVKCAGELYIGSRRGSIHLDYVYLQPGAWGRAGAGPFLKSGVDMLREMGITAIRLGGGFASESYYQWKHWRGLPEDRGDLGAKWGSDLMSGFGPFEALQLGEETGIEIIVDTAADAPASYHGVAAYAWKEPCCNTTDLADLIEYAAGNESTAWGEVRIADRGGKTEPYPLRYIELGNEQINSRFLEQVTAMEARAVQLGKGKFFSYIWPGNPSPPGGNQEGAGQSAGVEALGLGAQVLTDLHVGAGGGVQAAQQIFAQWPNLTFGAVNAETNDGTHTMLRAAKEAADLNVWLNCFSVDGNGEFCARLKLRTASFCSERSGHFDAYDQGISMFLPNTTWLQPPGLVHKLLKDTLQPNMLRINASDNRVSASAQRSDDGGTVVVRLANTNTAVNTTQSVMLELQAEASGTFLSGEQWTIASTDGDIMQCNTPGNPTAVSVVKGAFVLGGLVHLPPASVAVIVLHLEAA